MKQRAILTLIFGSLLLGSAARELIPFNNDWQFRFSHQVSGPGVRVNLPHTWNASDALAGRPDYYRGMGVYTKNLHYQPEWEGKRVYLRFQGANQEATVFVNDTFAGEHHNGYGAFVVDVTPLLRPGADNEIKVKVSNALSLDIMPLVGDFNMYGGIYRDVDVVVADPVGVSLTDYASPGVYLTQRNVTPERADVTATVVVTAPADARDVELVVTARDADGRAVASRNVSVTPMPDGSDQRVNIDFTVDNPRLWNGTADPYIYSVDAVVAADGKVTDSVTQPLGLRFFSVDPDKGFFLNGKHVPLHGVCRHQERAERGNALLPEHHDEDAAIMKEMGVNAVRLAHYPQSDYFYSLMDRDGVIAWAEIPFIGPGGYHDRGFNDVPAFRENGKEQLREMIRQHYNHPSIVMWGLFNELKTHGDNPVDYVKELNAIAHSEDSTRLTTAASFLDDASPLSDITDIIAWNKYYGWYGGSFDEMAAWLDSNHRNHPERCIGVSEYGAGASIYHQQDSVKAGIASGYWHPENWQTAFHRGNWEAIAQRPFVWGSFVWNMFDFGAAHRTEGDRNGINDKGLVTHDRKVRKDAFYYYKANWNTTDPFVYVASRRHTRRVNPATSVMVFSNQPEVELVVNGHNYGKRRSDGYGTFEWHDVELRPGANTVSASAPGVESDTVTWYLE